MNLTQNKVGVSIPYSMLRISLNPLTLGIYGRDQSLETLSDTPIFQTPLIMCGAAKYTQFSFSAYSGSLTPMCFRNRNSNCGSSDMWLVCPVFLAGLIFSYTRMPTGDCGSPSMRLYIMVTGFAYVAMVVVTPEPESLFLRCGNHILHLFRLHIRACSLYHCLDCRFYSCLVVTRRQ
jgi:two-component system cell cycle sensor histidine kinase/response regulator CckA